jgi:hypothetical protein
MDVKFINAPTARACLTPICRRISNDDELLLRDDPEPLLEDDDELLLRDDPELPLLDELLFSGDFSVMKHPLSWATV